MKCHTCGGNLQPGMTVDTLNRRTYHLIVHDVPAYVCDQCGEASLTGEVMKMFDETIAALDLLTEKLAAFAQARDAARVPETVP
jgi:YgiT-type zinc finger domain-containing protein